MIVCQPMSVQKVSSAAPLDSVAWIRGEMASGILCLPESVVAF